MEEGEGRMGVEGRRLVLGLVPDIDGCGLCLLDATAHEVLEMGTRTFRAPQDPKTKESLAAGRRAARSVRRNVARTRGRLSSCPSVGGRLGRFAGLSISGCARTSAT
ncbi:MAG: hypothetical protein MR874_02545 [Coriobacteriaceae bacterium]|nr:hypothetical protein [Coriobacteriaceae bacterium]MCI6843626.1 hypothetical protein [Coriobacteriaceae bacterium]MDD7585287.1 hypothetical protein [Coriobacteriaceae bacterium]